MICMARALMRLVVAPMPLLEGSPLNVHVQTPRNASRLIAMRWPIGHALELVSTEPEIGDFARAASFGFSWMAVQMRIIPRQISRIAELLLE